MTTYPRLTNGQDIQFTGINIPVDAAGVASSSRGLVGDTVFAVLPQVKPIHTFIITMAWQTVGQHVFFCSAMLIYPHLPGHLDQVVDEPILQILLDSVNS